MTYMAWKIAMQRIYDRSYNVICRHYAYERGRIEVCKRCDTYCEGYLEQLDPEDIFDKLNHEQEYLELCNESKNILLHPYEKKRIEEKIKLLKSYL